MLPDQKTLKVGDNTDWIFGNVSVTGRETRAVRINTSLLGTQAKLRVSHETTKSGMRRSLVSLSCPVPVQKTNAHGTYEGTSEAVVNLTVTIPEQAYGNTLAVRDCLLKGVRVFFDDATLAAGFNNGMA